MCFTDFAATLFNFFFNRRPREIPGGEASHDAAANEGSARGASSTHTSTEGQGTATSSGYDYEVFLSFRGPDTRAAFTDFLYISLKDAGIRVYKDDEDLRKGEEFGPELLQAIEQSRISIPIFSKDYASSVWCLKELVKIVECQKTRGQKIMPIFYDVAPSEVRHQIGGYGMAFRSHKNKRRHDEKIMQEWKDALSAVGAINGWDLQSMSNRREGQFAKELTEEVSRELKKAYLVVSNHLVSVDNHVNAIKEMIGAQTSETRIIGIWGMGGIGKTTTAKIVYNQLLENFDGCCFLSDIRETSQCKGIECLQSQLAFDILKNKGPNIRNSDDGINTIKARLSNKRVLLLLDDVDEKNHLDALVGERDWFGKGSKLIVTTRNKEVLDILKVDGHYELTGLDLVQSLQLFSKHAFRRDYPLNEYINQSNRAIGIAGGLPLALEVIGSLLSRTSMEMWDVTLDKLANVPHKDVQTKLKISYDALDVGQKYIFLDIACLFIGHDKNIVVYFWDESKFFPEVAMNVLQNMSLIKITADNEVWMHDQLKDLGRDIVRQESGMEIKKQSRVWDPEEGLHLLKRYKGNKEVQALRLKLDQRKQYCFTYGGFETLSDLRFLEVVCSWKIFHAEERLFWHELPSNDVLTNDFQENSNLLPQLRWLSWHDIPPTFNITNFSMEDVVFLDLSWSDITDDWKGWSHMKVIKNLKVLNLSHCYCLKRLSDTIGNLKSLIELNISYTGIEELPDSIGKLKNLKALEMRGSEISKIPDAFWTIEKLEKIEIHCKGVKCDMEIGDCIRRNQSLRVLQLSKWKIHALPRLPEGLIELSLESMHIDTIPDLSYLANLKKWELHFHMDTISDLSYLTDLKEVKLRLVRTSYYYFEDIVGLLLEGSNHVTKLQADRGNPPDLKSLHLHLSYLRGLPTLPSTLSSLRLFDCGSFRVANLSNLKQLSSLHIIKTEIAEIRVLGCLENLRDLVLSSIGKVERLPDLSNLTKLRSLQVSSCYYLVEIEGNLPRSLDDLSITDCDSLQNLPDLSSLVGKQSFRISNCRKLNQKAIQVFAEQNRQNLEIVGFRKLRILPDLSNSTELRSLEVKDCDNLVEIQEELPHSLEALTISNCRSLQELPALSRLKELRWFKIAYCTKLSGKSILSSARRNRAILPENLQDLYIWAVGGVKILPDISNLNKLRHLWVMYCGDLVEIQGDLPESLETLQISSCQSFQKLPNLSSLKELQSATIGTQEMREVKGFLKICGLGQVEILPDLSNLNKIRNLLVKNCGHLIEIQGELPEYLEGLEISFCESLKKLPDLSSLKKLQGVKINRCEKLNVKEIRSHCLERSVELNLNLR